MKMSGSAIHPKKRKKEKTPSTVITVHADDKWRHLSLCGSDESAVMLQAFGWRKVARISARSRLSVACSEVKRRGFVNSSWSREGVSLNNISALWFNLCLTTFSHAWVNSYACSPAAVQGSASLLLLSYIKNVCVCVSRWLCVHSTVNWSGCSLDWMEKGPGREVHTPSADGRAHCVAITRHSSSLGMLSGPRPTHHHHHHHPLSSQGLFEPVSRRWQRCSLLFLIWPSKPGVGTVGWQEGRKGGGVFFRKALWVAGLICHSLFPLCALALSLPSERHATTPVPLHAELTEASQWLAIRGDNRS